MSEITIIVKCDECQNELEFVSQTGDTVYFKKCEVCAENNYKKGYDEGKEAR